MVDETVVVAEETAPEVIEVVETPTVSPVETEARSQGWRPKEEFVAAGGDESEWRSAKEFTERGDFFKTIHQLKRENKQTQAALSALQKHHQYVFDQAHRTALADLKKERREALRSEDIDRVEQIETQIEEKQAEFQTAKAALQQEQVAAQAAGPHPEFQVWAERNKWYHQDQDLRDFADAMGVVYTNRNPNRTPEDVLKHVETEVKKKFPEKFGVRKGAPSPTTAPDRTVTAGRKVAKSTRDLPEEAREIMKTLVRSGALTEAQYIKEYFGDKD